ncbi:MAG: cytochrome c oxidase subunit II [Cyanobacteriota bacterium]|nr:cytochrome c oxidase subunit II [Cyanobacteriota bacterium]
MKTALLIGCGLLADAAITRWMVAQVPHWLPVQASAAAPHVDALFALETGIGTFLFVGCVAVILTTVLFRRAPKYDLVNGDPIEGNLKLEITWTLIPLLIVALLTWQAMRVNSTLATLGGKQRVTDGSEAMALSAAAVVAGDAAERPYGPVQVIARQWSWEFVYPDGVRSAELHLPLDQPVLLELVSLDVLHGLYVPAFRLKQDVIPGSVIAYRLTPTREGRYRLRDSLFSGAYFASNQTNVVVEAPEAFQAWLREAGRQPLRPSWNPAQELHERRLRRGDQGWATVPPAAPPLVNAGLDPQASHEA